jgi:RNA polymerase sigma factor (sigma-70 family)
VLGVRRRRETGIGPRKTEAAMPAGANVCEPEDFVELEPSTFLEEDVGTQVTGRSAGCQAGMRVRTAAACDPMGAGRSAILAPRMDDAALFQAWANGDRAAGETLYGRYFRPLYRFFRAKVPDDYEDLIQTTMLECVRSRDRFRGDAPFRAFLFGVARHRLLHYLRAKGGNRLDFDASQSSMADVDPRPSTILARQAEHQLLLEAMQRLPVDLQLALELHYWEELGTKELAEVLEIPQGTVKSRLRRAKQLLQVELERLAEDPAARASAVAGLETWMREIRALVGK